MLARGIRSTFLGEFQQHPKCAIYLRRILEHSRYIGVEENDVRTGLVRLVMLSANRSAEVVFRLQVVFFRISLLIHTVFAPWESLREH
jgi:hypothetical protein